MCSCLLICPQPNNYLTLTSIAYGRGGANVIIVMLPTATSAAPASVNFRKLLEEIYIGRGLFTYKSGQQIALQPQDIWVVCRGMVKLTTLYPNGDEAILGLVYPSMPFGLPFTQVHPYEALALSSEVVLMRFHQMELEHSPRLAQGIFQQLSRRLAQTEHLLSIVGERRIEDRLRHLLDLLQQEVGQVNPEGIKISVRLTHQQIASLIGSTRVTVTRLLRQFFEEGWLRQDQKRYLILVGAKQVV